MKTTFIGIQYFPALTSDFHHFPPFFLPALRYALRDFSILLIVLFSERVIGALVKAIVLNRNSTPNAFNRVVLKSMIELGSFYFVNRFPVPFRDKFHVAVCTVDPFT